MLEIGGTGLDWSYSIYQGHPYAFVQKATYDYMVFTFVPPQDPTRSCLQTIDVLGGSQPSPWRFSLLVVSGGFHLSH